MGSAISLQHGRSWDGNWFELDAHGNVTLHLGNQGDDGTSEDLSDAARVLKNASEIKNPELRKAVIKAAQPFCSEVTGRRSSSRFWIPTEKPSPSSRSQRLAAPRNGNSSQ